MTTNYQCSGCGGIISADPELTPTVQCTACSTTLSLVPSVNPGGGAVTYMDYQCPGCGASNSADPVATPEVHCNTCLTRIKLGQAQAQELQSVPSPAMPEPEVVAKTQAPEPELSIQSEFPELGAAAKDILPELGAAVKKELPELGAAVKKKLPELGAAVKKELPELGAALKKDLPEPEATEEKNAIIQEGAESSHAATETEAETESEDEDTEPKETSIELSDSATEQKEPRVRPGWLKFLLQARVLIIGLGIAPVMITVVVGAILVFIRCGTGIANGEGDMLIQGGQIVLGLVSLWAMYILGMTFYFADRDWVTDFGHFVMIGGACWGMYAVVSTFPSTSLAIAGHLFFGYVCLAAVALAVWLLAPYKGIGSPR